MKHFNGLFRRRDCLISQAVLPAIAVGIKPFTRPTYRTLAWSRHHNSRHHNSRHNISWVRTLLSSPTVHNKFQQTQTHQMHPLLDSFNPIDDPQTRCMGPAWLLTAGCLGRLSRLQILPPGATCGPTRLVCVPTSACIMQPRMTGTHGAEMMEERGVTMVPVTDECAASVRRHAVSTRPTRATAAACATNKAHGKL